MRTKSYDDISKQWQRLYKLTYRETPYRVPEWRMKWWKRANEIAYRYKHNIIAELDRLHGYKTHRDIWEKFPASIYAK